MMNRFDLPDMLNTAGLVGKGVEVGVLRGDFSNFILTHWKGKKLFMVDSWQHISGLRDCNNPDTEVHLNNMVNACLNTHIHRNRACIIRDMSVRAAELFDDGELDFIYLDAGHDFESVTRDLEAWFPKIKDGGLLCGDDYLDGEKYETTFAVKSAVDKFFEGKEVGSTWEDQPTWWVWK